MTELTTAERKAQGKAAREKAPLGVARRDRARRRAATRSAWSSARRRPACPSSCRSGTGGCWSRRSPSTAAPRCRWRPTCRRCRRRGCGCSCAVTRTCRTSGCSGLPTAGSSSTSTTSTRPCPGRSSGTSSGSPPAWPWPAATSGWTAKDRKTLVLAGVARLPRRAWPSSPRRRCSRSGTPASTSRTASSGCAPKVRRGGPGRTRKAMAKARTRDSMQVLKKLTTVVDGQRRIISNPPLVVPIEELTDRHSAEEIMARMATLLTQYRRTLSADRRHLVEQFRLVGVARKVVGVGSVGTRAWILLLEADGGQEPLFLQAKEAQRSVLADYCGASKYRNEGQRVVAGQHLMQAASDIFLGWQHVESGLDGRSARLLRAPAARLEVLRRDRADGAARAGRVRRAVRLDPRACARPLGRPVRHRGLPRQVRQVRPGPGEVRRGATPTAPSRTTRRWPPRSPTAGSRRSPASERASRPPPPECPGRRSGQQPARAG